MTSKAKRITKADIARMAAGAMNLLNDIRATLNREDSGLTGRQEGEFWELVGMLDEETQAYFANNGTLNTRDLM